MDIKSIAKLLASIIEDNTTATAYLANPNTTRPTDDSLCSVKFIESKNIGYDGVYYSENTDSDTSDTDYDLIESVIGLRELTYLLNFQKDDSNQNAIDMKQAFRKTSVQESLNDNDCVFVSATDPMNAIEPISSTEYEERSIINVVIRTRMTTTDELYSIDSVTLKTETTNNITNTIEVN